MAMDGEDTYNNLRVASFSYYLNAAEENCVLTRGLSDSSYTAISPEETPRLNNLGRSKKNELEISIFSAEKYFSCKSSDINTFKCGYENESCVSEDQSVQNVIPNTPITCSEASSWNSQSASLKGSSRNFSPRKYKNGVGTKFYPIFCCKGTCLEKKDFGVLRRIHQSPGLKNADQFSVPVPNSGIGNLKAKKFVKEKTASQDEIRSSTKVYVSAMTREEDIADKLERKLCLLTWDAIPKTQNLKPSPNFVSYSLYDDMASEDSSDLFELENISGTKYPMLSTKESRAPHKAISGRNFLKGSAADMSSVVSDHVERSDSGSGDTISICKSTKLKDSCTKEVPKSGRSWLFGCKSYRAVRIAENTHRTSDKIKVENKYVVPPNLQSLTRFAGTSSARKEPSPLQPAGK